MKVEAAIRRKRTSFQRGSANGSTVSNQYTNGEPSEEEREKGRELTRWMMVFYSWGLDVEKRNPVMLNAFSDAYDLIKRNKGHITFWAILQTSIQLYQTALSMKQKGASLQDTMHPLHEYSMPLCRSDYSRCKDIPHNSPSSTAVHENVKRKVLKCRVQKESTLRRH